MARKPVRDMNSDERRIYCSDFVAINFREYSIEEKEKLYAICREAVEWAHRSSFTSKEYQEYLLKEEQRKKESQPPTPPRQVETITVHTKRFSFFSH